MALVIGVVACLHGKLGIARKLVSRFKKAGVDMIVLDGDIPSDDDQYINFCKLLSIFAKSGKEVFVLPGSHEHYDDYTKAVKKFKGKVVDCSRFKKQKRKGVQLVFLPGSDVISRGGGFKLVEDDEEREQLHAMKKMHEYFYGGKLRASAISDLENLDHENALLFCHVPPKFTGKTAIDRARFGIPTKHFILDGDIVVKGESIFTMEHTRELKKKGAPLKVTEKNVGNPVLKKTLKAQKIRRFICGHIHEAGGRATTLSGKTIRAGTWTDELFYNVAAGKEGRAGIVTVDGGRVKHQNIKV